jgi:hypothetical protein
MVNEHINHRDDFTPANLYYEVTLGITNPKTNTITAIPTNPMDLADILLSYILIKDRLYAEK